MQYDWILATIELLQTAFEETGDDIYARRLALILYDFGRKLKHYPIVDGNGAQGGKFPISTGPAFTRDGKVVGRPGVDLPYPGDGDYEGLLVYADVTESARSLQSMVPRLIAEMRSVLSDAEPEVPMGAQCMKPFECPFISHCSGSQAEMPVSWLPGGRTAAAKLVAEGYEDIREIPAGHLTNETSEWARRVTVAGESELRPQAAEEMNALGWPRYYFDFETMAPVVPVFAGTSPYKAQAFQWSCHVESADGELNDWGFLATGPEAPMRACAESMISVLGDSGPVLTYTTYELGVIEGFI
jgi:hypothetical protein